MQPGNTCQPVTFRPFWVSLDWLQIAVSVPVGLFLKNDPIKWVGGLTWLPQDKSAPPFRRMAYLVDGEGEKLLAARAIPASSMHAPDFGILQFSNKALWLQMWCGIWDTCKEMGFRYQGVTRVDVCADTLPSEGGNYMEPIAHAMQGNAKYYGKGKWAVYHMRDEMEGATLGTRAGNKFIRCYNKTKEMKRAPKQHIVDVWRSIGVDVKDIKEDVWRMEIQTRGRELRRYYPDERGERYLHELQDATHRCELFQSMTNTLFDFRTKADRSRDAIPLASFDWTAVTTDPLEVAERDRRSLAFGINTIKASIRMDYMCFLETNDPTWRHVAESRAHAADLYAWMVKSAPKWTAEVMTMKHTSGPLAGKFIEPRMNDLFNRLKL